MYTAHRIVCEPSPVGLVMRETTAEEDKMFSRCPLSKEDIENLQVDLYKQVCIYTQGDKYCVSRFYTGFFTRRGKLDIMYFSTCIVCFALLWVCC